ncbi:uncharacterized protein BDR25DRAFT_367477 [Lindgomyces ingoldianus]|uniref:Uncharacterized protein n=1 Tax=Lindgomyces ingoldianus TaxID=673940 RepID=A0ACB6QZT3_9PLEO|nr:uncharacterized protein BDR25DRAFT_367477 [Lindgomyces ingoldianus]KAF2471711.1 hypothetical protein BDR25DRAFT_367477 [Lindgomyces ingoldianus]
MSMSECCKTGFSWGGKPVGTETTLAKNNVSVNGTPKSVAVLIVHDIFGWTFENLRLLAGHFAKEVYATVYRASNGPYYALTVYLPDFFDDEVVGTDVFNNSEKRAEFDLMGFTNRHGKDVRFPEIKASAKALKSRLLENNEIGGLKVPVQILSPETDPAYISELKEYPKKVIPTLGILYEYVYFPGFAHGFATRGAQNDTKQKNGLERAKKSAVNFFNEFMH